MGALEDQSLWVNDIIPGGNGEMNKVSCVFPPERLAQVANDIVEGKIEGRIVGWYHSHPGHGLFLSQTDLDTHMGFYQFSPYALSLVAEPSSGEFGIWIYENGWACCSYQLATFTSFDLSSPWPPAFLNEDFLNLSR